MNTSSAPVRKQEETCPLPVCLRSCSFFRIPVVVKGEAANEEDVEHASEGPDVGGDGILVLADKDLGAHVLARADVRRRRRLVLGIEALGEAKVTDEALDLADRHRHVAHHHVLQLEVAVDHVQLVQVIQAVYGKKVKKCRQRWKNGKNVDKDGRMAKIC